MQILGGSSAGDFQPSWVHQGSTVSPLLTPPPPPPPSFLTTSTTTTPSIDLHPHYSSTVSPTLLRLCQLWPYIHNAPAPSPPDICNNLLLIDHRRDIFRNSQYHYGQTGSRNTAGPGERAVGVHHIEDELTFSGRSFSLMGVLGGVLFILLVIAFITCIRHRKRVRNEADGELDLDVISSRIRRIHQARAGHHLLSVLSSMPEVAPVPPPDYDTVLKQREKEESDLPSYLEAIRESEELQANTVGEDEQSHSCFIPVSCFQDSDSCYTAAINNANISETASSPSAVSNQTQLAEVHAGKKTGKSEGSGPSQSQQDAEHEPDLHSELIQQPDHNIQHV